MLNLVVHLYGGELVHRNDHSLAEEPTTRKVVCDIPGDFIQAVFAFDDFQNAGTRIFKQSGFGIVQIFIFDNRHDIVIEKVVLQANFRNAAAIEQRYRRAVFHRLREVIFRNIVAKPLVRQAFAPQ